MDKWINWVEFMTQQYLATLIVLCKWEIIGNMPEIV